MAISLRRRIGYGALGLVLLGCSSYRTPHGMMRAAPSKASPSRLAYPTLPAPPDEAWLVVYNDVDAPKVTVDSRHGTFGDVPAREAAVLRLEPGRHVFSVHEGTTSAKLGAELRAGCVYFARILDARGKLELIAERRMDAVEWMEYQRIAAPRRDTPWDHTGTVGLERIDEAPEWFQTEAVCERVSSPP